MQEYRNFYFDEQWEDNPITTEDDVEMNTYSNCWEFFDSLIELSVDATSEEEYFDKYLRIFSISKVVNQTDFLLQKDSKKLKEEWPIPEKFDFEKYFPLIYGKEDTPRDI